MLKLFNLPSISQKSSSLRFTAGNIVCTWGRGEDGQLGHGDAEDRPSPTQLNTLDGPEIVSVTCGADHTIAYSESHANVYSWGWFVLHLFIDSSKFLISVNILGTTFSLTSVHSL